MLPFANPFLIVGLPFWSYRSRSNLCSSFWASSSFHFLLSQIQVVCAFSSPGRGSISIATSKSLGFFPPVMWLPNICTLFTKGFLEAHSRISSTSVCIANGILSSVFNCRSSLKLFHSPLILLRNFPEHLNETTLRDLNIIESPVAGFLPRLSFFFDFILFAKEGVDS